MPRCSTCQKDKGVSHFYRDASRSTGVSSRCRECERAKLRERYAADPDAFQGSAARWRDANREHKRAADTEYNRTRRKPA